jgi:hypothetical protein
MASVWKDIQFALRAFRKSPVFTAVALLSLALGIGANTAIFTLLDQVLLRLMPVKDPQELVLLHMKGFHYGSNWGDNSLSYPMYRDFKANNSVFSGMFCRFGDQFSLGFNGTTELANGELVSGTYFPVLGVAAAIGRTFTPDDDAELCVLAIAIRRRPLGCRKDADREWAQLHHRRRGSEGLSGRGFRQRKPGVCSDHDAAAVEAAVQ